MSCVWFISFSTVASGFYMLLHMVQCSSFLKLNYVSLTSYTMFYLSIHLLTRWIASMSWVLWIMLQLRKKGSYLFSILISIFFIYKSRSGIVGSYDNSIFYFLRYLHTVFHSTTAFYIITHSVQEFPFPHILANSSLF